MMNGNSPARANTQQLMFWKRTCQLTAGLLLVWFSLIMAALFFARELATIQWLGWNLSFYLAAQGLTLSFVILIGIYALAMRALARQLRDNREHA